MVRCQRTAAPSWFVPRYILRGGADVFVGRLVHFHDNESKVFATFFVVLYFCPAFEGEDIQILSEDQTFRHDQYGTVTESNAVGTTIDF